MSFNNVLHSVHQYIMLTYGDPGRAEGNAGHAHHDGKAAGHGRGICEMVRRFRVKCSSLNDQQLESPPSTVKIGMINAHHHIKRTNSLTLHPCTPPPLFLLPRNLLPCLYSTVAYTLHTGFTDPSCSLLCTHTVQCWWGPKGEQWQSSLSH